jgi:formylmethanofuran dehydrogenase subunit C
MIQRIRSPEPKLTASKRFGRYKKESVSPVRELQVDRLLRQWEEITSDKKGHGYLHFVYEHVWQWLKEMDYRPTPREVRDFSILVSGMDSYDRWVAGQFFSAAINQGQGDAFEVVAPEYQSPMIGLGYGNIKDIIVQGNSGFDLGQRNRGTITVHGNANPQIGKCMGSGFIRIDGNAVGEPGYFTSINDQTIGDPIGSIIGHRLKDGLITIEGDTLLCHIGRGMRGGRIIIKGDMRWDDERIKRFRSTLSGRPITPSVGENMQGGEIHIGGDISRIGNVVGGRIYHRGKLIVDK